MASISWFPILLGVLLAALLTRTYPLAAFVLMLLAISAVAEWQRRGALRSVTFRRRFDVQRGFPNEILPMKLEVENRKFMPLAWLRVLDLIPYQVGPEDESLLDPTHLPEQGLLTALFSLRWFERDRRTFHLLLRKRGVYRLGPARLEAGDFFGLFQVEQEQTTQDSLTVFPLPVDFDSLRLPVADPFGERKARRRLYEDPTLMMGVREYQPDDDFRRVHWPSTARAGQLMVKVYQPISARVLVVCLNVLTLPHYWEGTDPALLEYLVSVSAAVVQKGLEEGYRVGLISNTCLSHADQPFRVPAGSSPGQLVQLLSALAGATPFITSPFDRFLLNEAPQLPYGATLMVITGLMDEGIAAGLLRLRRSGRRVRLLNFARNPSPPIVGVDVFHRPFDSLR